MPTEVQIYQDGTIVEADIANNAVTDVKIANNAVTDVKIATGAVTVDKIATGAVTDVKIGTGAVTSGKIGLGAVTTSKIAANAVTTDKISDDAVTALKIENGAVTASKLYAGGPTWDNAPGAPGTPNGKLTTAGAAVVPNRSYIKLGDAYISSGGYQDISGSASYGRLAHFGTNVYFVSGSVGTPPIIPANNNWQCDDRGPGGLYQIYSASGTNLVTHSWWKHNGVSSPGWNPTNLMLLDNNGILQTLQGYRGRQGSEGGTGGNVFNIFWDGTGAQLWIDNAYVGSISLVSDYRIKKNIQTQTSSAIERVSKLRPITYEYQNYGELYKEDGVQREGFIAHELAEVIPSAVEGEKDAPNQIQSLRLDALVSVLTKALQEAIGRIETLEAEVAELKNLK